jgi:YVTN family beta-propeller protein
MLSLLLACYALPDRSVPFLHMPSVNTYATHNPDGETILPEGRLLRPAGNASPLRRWPSGMAWDPNRDEIFVASDGVGQFITDWEHKDRHIERIPIPKTGKRSEGAGGCAFSPDGKSVYWSSGESGEVYQLDATTHELTNKFSLNSVFGGKKFDDSYVSALALGADGKYLYCADETNFRLVIFDTISGRLVSSVGTGRYPAAIASLGSRVYVANIGQFSYSAIPKGDGSEPDPRGLTFPAFGYPSREAETGGKAEGRNVPGLGSPLAEEAFSVYGFDIADPLKPRVLFKQKTGFKIGSKQPWGQVVGGSAPSFVLASKTRIFVSNDNDDTVDKLDANSGRLLGTASLEPSPLVHGIKGVGPSGSVLSPNGDRLYVAESGLNAIAVIDTATMKVLGNIPTAWYPYRVGISKDGSTLSCICFKGFGNGPKGGKSPMPTDEFRLMAGSFHAIPIPSATELAKDAQIVLENDGLIDASADRQAMSSPVWSSIPGSISKQIKYVVFIDKENHTYDTIFDHIKGANDDPTLLKWGLKQRVTGPGQPELTDAAIGKNHNRLARQYAVSDNFYVEPEASGVGHRWLIGVQPNNWCQMIYTLGFDFKNDTEAPGRRASFGSNASMAPEDYPAEGAMWHQLARHGISFRSYGEGFEFAGVLEDEKEENSGAREVVNIPMPKVLFDNTCREFPNFNMNIPDVYKAELFEKEVKERNLSGKIPFPHFVDIALSNDHPSGPSPKHGYPYSQSFFADDDWALGKIVEFLSHTPYWKNMAIFVTEDDAGGEPDHVDAQRSVMLMIGPYVKHGYVSHRHTTITSMHRTLYEIFGLPPLNIFDATSNDFSDAFTSTPDFTPYAAERADPRLYDLPKSRDVHDWNYQKARRLATVPMDTWDKDDD